MTKGERIRELRIEHKMTQEQLADMLNIKKQTVHKYEKNIITNIPSDKIEQMAKIFSVSPLFIMGLSDDAGTPSSGSSLTDGERQIVSSFRQLNEEGRERLLNYADDLVASGRYIKTGSADMVEEK